MFDDQPLKNPGQVPGNLPISEPDDMFSGTDEAEKIPVVSAPSSSSALNAGVLKPKMDTEAHSRMQRSQQPPAGNFGNPDMSSAQTMPGRIDNLEEPVGRSKLVLTIVIILVVALVGAGVVWGYFAYVKNRLNGGAITAEGQDAAVGENTASDAVPAETATVPTINNPENVQPNLPTADDQILFGEPVDTDGDGLVDDREKELETNSLNWDTDGDGLSDGDEVNNWKTNPLLTDTDKDNFPDGVEVKNGYNPNGPGRFVDVLNNNTALPVPGIATNTGVSTPPANVTTTATTTDTAVKNSATGTTNSQP